MPDRYYLSEDAAKLVKRIAWLRQREYENPVLPDSGALTPIAPIVKPIMVTSLTGTVDGDFIIYPAYITQSQIYTGTRVLVNNCYWLDSNGAIPSLDVIYNSELVGSYEGYLVFEGQSCTCFNALTHGQIVGGGGLIYTPTCIEYLADVDVDVDCVSNALQVTVTKTWGYADVLAANSSGCPDDTSMASMALDDLYDWAGYMQGKPIEGVLTEDQKREMQERWLAKMEAKVKRERRQSRSLPPPSEDKFQKPEEIL